jgi:hypothetical protein
MVTMEETRGGFSVQYLELPKTDVTDIGSDKWAFSYREGCPKAFWLNAADLALVRVKGQKDCRVCPQA